MRLSTDRDRDETAAVAVIHAALEAGATILDTAAAYCWNDDDRGHNERLIARALSTWDGDRASVTIATKGGMTRPGGSWVADGRAKHLAASAEASCRALGIDCIPLYQLHAPDPRVPLATSVRALADLKRRGIVAGIGLCNVTVGQIEEARRIVDLDAIQVEASLWHDQHVLSGVVRYCADHRLRLLAHRPLGGVKSRARTAGNPVLIEVAAEHGATPFDIALAWLTSLSDVIDPLPGATTIESARAVARYRTLRLTDEQLARIDNLCPSARLLRSERPVVAVAGPARRTDAEVVMIMGLPGSGKSTLARDLESRGYRRLNRDDAGGTLRGLIPALDRALASGTPRVVLDNTYVSRASRAPVIQAAAARGVPVRCIWLSTSVADAQVNAVSRIVERYGRLLDAAEIAALRPRDPAALPPMTQFRYQRQLEPPDMSEGFAQVEVVPFERRLDPAHVNRAVIVWFDPGDLVLDSARGATLRRHAEQGFRLLGLSWQPGVAAGTRTAADVEALIAAMNRALGIAIGVEYCPHPAGPPTCWCRKPLPGLPVLLIHRHQLDPRQCIYVGEGAQDAGYAKRLGLQYRTASDFFGG